MGAPRFLRENTHVYHAIDARRAKGEVIPVFLWALFKLHRWGKRGERGPPPHRLSSGFNFYLTKDSREKWTPYFLRWDFIPRAGRVLFPESLGMPIMGVKSPSFSLDRLEGETNDPPSILRLILRIQYDAYITMLH